MNPTPITFIQGTSSEVSDDLWAMVLRGVDCSGYLTTRMRIKTTLPPAASTANNNETSQYFYHSDHLGSASFISDATGYATQHLQYLPYGETFVDQHGAFDSRYKFSAKELDDETQYSYFGARYYDSDLSVWLSVDPMSDGYPSLSPFAYCGNSPIVYVDIDGNSFWHPDKNGNLVADAGDDVYSLHVYLNRYGQVPVPFELVRRLYGSMYHGEPISDPEGQMITFATFKQFFGSHTATMWNPGTNFVHQGQEDFINSPPTQLAVDILIFIATGGIEGVVSLGRLSIKAILRIATKESINLTKSQIKTITSLERQIAKHEVKLAEYIKDPLKYDNKSFLKNAPTDAIQQKIIQSRINHLQQEIQTFKDNIFKIKNGD